MEDSPVAHREAAPSPLEPAIILWDWNVESVPMTAGSGKGGDQGAENVGDGENTPPHPRSPESSLSLASSPSSLPSKAAGEGNHDHRRIPQSETRGGVARVAQPENAEGNARRCSRRPFSDGIIPTFRTHENARRHFTGAALNQSGASIGKQVSPTSGQGVAGSDWLSISSRRLITKPTMHVLIKSLGYRRQTGLS